MSYEEPDLYEDEESGGLLPEFLLDPIGALQRRWIAMLACVLLGLVGTAFAFLSWKPAYEAYASVLITGQKMPGGLVVSTVDDDNLDNVNAMMGQVLSVENLSRLIDELGLFPKESAEKPRIDLVNAMRSRIDHGAQRTRSRRRDEALVYGLSYTSSNPQEAADVTNALAGLFVESSFNRRNQQAQQTTEFLKTELVSDEKELREQSGLVAEFRREYRGQLPDELNTNLRKLDMLAARRESVGLQISEKENRILSISSRGGDGPLTENEVLLGELRRELARETAVHTDEHPNVIALRDRIDRLEATADNGSTLSAAQRAIIISEQRDIERLRGLLTQFDQEMAEINLRIDNTPLVGEKLAALEQREQVMREDYLDSLRKVEAAELAENLESARQGGQVSVIDAAQRPSRPVHSRWLVLLAGVAGSAVLGLMAVVLLELIDPVIVGHRQIEKLSKRPVLGSLPDFA